MVNEPIIIANYRLRRKIDEGGMATVYLANSESDGESYALKILRPDLASDQDNVDAFLWEAEVGAKVSHPSLVKVYDYGCSNGFYYILLEYIDGITLKEVLDSCGRMNVERALLVVEQMVDAFSATWQAEELVHNDIKPENILLWSDDQVKLADLALAECRLLHTENTDDIYGTPCYMAPERLQGNAVDYRSDVYSLGATLYHVLAGHVPFPADEPEKQVRRHLTDPLIPLCLALPDIPKNVSRLIELMMAKRMEHRHTDLDALKADIRSVRNDEYPTYPLATDAQVPLLETKEKDGLPSGTESHPLSGVNQEVVHRHAETQNVTSKETNASGTGDIFKRLLGLFGGAEEQSADLQDTGKGEISERTQNSRAPMNLSGWWDTSDKEQIAEEKVFEEIDSYQLFSGLLNKLRKGETVVVDIPENINRVINLLNQADEFRYQDIIPPIQKSPSLTGHILRIANSPTYRRGESITELRVALPRIPPATLKSILYLHTTETVLEVDESIVSVIQAIVQHCLAVSVIAAYLAPRFSNRQYTANDASTAGLLHDVGKIALLKELDEQFSWDASAADIGRLHEGTFERILPIMHEKAGRYIADNWGLADPVCFAMSAHHVTDFSTFEDSPVKNLTALLHLSDAMARMLGYGKSLQGLNLFDLSAARFLGAGNRNGDMELFEEIPDVLKSSVGS